ncbi:hypothetical protein ADL21_35770 [Streptomyces albus subsp. albus]|nr:hypothetical protein ADL21_35770 [Streptomyces albus subsp. albus]
MGLGGGSHHTSGLRRGKIEALARGGSVRRCMWRAQGRVTASRQVIDVVGRPQRMDADSPTLALTGFVSSAPLDGRSRPRVRRSVCPTPPGK